MIIFFVKSTKQNKLFVKSHQTFHVLCFNQEKKVEKKTKKKITKFCKKICIFQKNDENVKNKEKKKKWKKEGKEIILKRKKENWCELKWKFLTDAHWITELNCNMLILIYKKEWKKGKEGKGRE